MSETTPRYAAGQSEALRLMQCPIAGFQYHGGEACWNRIRAGDRLLLRREPGNRHDPRAITVEWQEVMLGFVPREANYALSQMMDSGMRVEGRVASLRQGEDPWQRVMMEVLAQPAAASASPARRPQIERVILRPESKLVVPRLQPARAALAPAQREIGLRVLAECVPEIAQRLTMPVIGTAGEHGRTLRAWNCISLAIGADGRGLHAHYIEAPAGSPAPFVGLDLKHPLGEDGWLGAFVALIARVCDRHGLNKSNMAEPLRRWIGTSLRLTFEDLVDFEVLRKTALEFLAPNPLARSLANRIFAAPPSSEAFNWVCARVPAIALCAVEHPAMLPFLRICHGEKGLEEPLDPLAALHKRLMAEGITPAAWKNLAKWGFDAFAAIGEAWWKPIPLARFANLLQKLQVQGPPPRQFIDLAFRAARYRDEPHARLNFERHPLWLMRAMLRALDEGEADVTTPALVRGDLAGCLDWLIDTRPRPDANQQQAGWNWIREQAQAHRRAVELALAEPWPVPIEQMIWGPFLVVAIRSAAELMAEAMAMKNCLESYEEACRAGDVIVFSLRERANGARIACFAAQRDEDDASWSVMEVAGKLNASVAADIQRVAEATVVKLNGGRGGEVPPF